MIDSLGGDRDRIQTCNRLIRSQLLYSVELRGHCCLSLCFDNGCKGTVLFLICKLFLEKISDKCRFFLFSISQVI